ncbi:HlyD family secretion protein [uncultured Bacteroides sp.]|uniref:HlyD family secretion protein n=1 Tax=uncultured Bacteroides sp. TaxID=162156 RepID=UPI002AAA8700|nr:HlyD family secretion protein [uncultured Bacteroides sp.]
MDHKRKKLINNIVIVLVLACGVTWVCSRFVHLGNVEYTDNAQVKQLIVPVNSRVQGFIKKICFEENQYVHKGDTLVLIEDTEFRFRVAQAEADYQNAISGKTVMSSSINTTQNNISVSDAGIQEAKIRLDNAEREYNRYKNLLGQGAVTKQQYDNIKTDYDASKARYELLVREKQSTTLVKQEQTHRLGQNTAGIKLAEAALGLAKLNLSYTVITAPCDGTTGRKNIQEGMLIQPGQALVDLVDENDKWIIANYKETQTANIHDGQVVNVEVDAIPNVVFKGTVESLAQATGASFSLFPQDNSAGNFVKVEQRIPIRIKFSKENSSENLKRLRAGMNVECEVNY